MLQPIWAMIKPFGFAVLWIWHPSEVSALSGWFDAAFSLINSGVVARIGCQVLTQAFATTTDMLNAA